MHCSPTLRVPDHQDILAAWSAADNQPKAADVCLSCNPCDLSLRHTTQLTLAVRLTLPTSYKKHDSQLLTPFTLCATPSLTISDSQLPHFFFFPFFHHDGVPAYACQGQDRGGHRPRSWCRQGGQGPRRRQQWHNCARKGPGHGNVRQGQGQGAPDQGQHAGEGQQVKPQAHVNGHHVAGWFDLRLSMMSTVIQVKG